MRHSLIANLIGFLLLYTLSSDSAFSKKIDGHFLSSQLEVILNKQKHSLIKDLFLKESFKQFNQQYLNFIKNYKDAKWSIKTISNDPDRTFLDVNITSTRRIGNQVYNLNSKQTVKLETIKNKIKSYEVVSEESILNTKKSPLVVEIFSPNEVLTGERYEINLIIEKPLDNSLIASGIIVLENNENKNISNNQFGIKLTQSGGLFKYIQAPLKPGFQTVSAIITHPKGIYSITKKIKVGL